MAKIYEPTYQDEVAHEKQMQENGKLRQQKTARARTTRQSQSHLTARRWSNAPSDLLPN